MVDPTVKDRTRDRVLAELKASGAQTAQRIAEQFSLSLMGAHKALQVLVDEGLVRGFNRSEGRGRPKRYFELTGEGHRQFPDRHGVLTAELLSDVQNLFGDDGLDRLVLAREARQRAEYQKITDTDMLARLRKLAAIRNREGYMARIEQGDDEVLLIEDHCPICVAATACQGYCRSELDLFRMVAGADAEVERVEHLISGGRRCTYRISPSRIETTR